MVAQISAFNPIPKFQVLLDFFSDINDACCGLVFVIGVVFAVILFLFFKKKRERK
jgi:hypothetical protein